MSISLALTSEQGYGYFPAIPGQFLKDGRYKVSRMLAIGQSSSVFMVRELVEDDDDVTYAAKILTAFATKMTRQGRLHELENLQAISELTDLPPYLPELIDHFETTGPHGDHLCFILGLQSTDVGSFRLAAPTRRLLLHDVQMVILYVLNALAILHKLGLIHTDVKPSDVLLIPGVEDSVLPIFDGEIELRGKTYPILRPQPLPHTFKWDDGYMDAELRLFCLNDVGHAIRTDREKDYVLGTTCALRAPEVVLRAGYDCKIDIWAVGCMAFELLTGRQTFDPQGGDGFSVDDEHLSRMLELTGQAFSPSMLDRSELRDKFFNNDGKLKRTDAVQKLGIKSAISNYDVLAEDDIASAAEFIAACLSLDPASRPSAHDLMYHPWVRDADWCRDYRSPTLRDRPPSQ